MLDLVAALHAGLKEKESQRHAWDKEAVHVTDLSITLGGDDGGCPLALWKRVRGHERKAETLGQMLMFDNAHSLHERSAELLDLGLPDEWEIVEIEKSVADKLPRGMKGRLDIKLRNTKTGVTLIVDIKTVRGQAFKFLDGPKPAHVLQVQTYIWAENADGGLIIYLDREGQNAALQFSVPRADTTVLDAMARTYRIVNAEQPPAILPPKITRKPYKTRDDLITVKVPWQCSYCPFLDIGCPSALSKNARDLTVEFRVDGKGNVRLDKCEAPSSPDGVPLMSAEEINAGVKEISALVQAYIENEKTKETNNGITSN